MDSFGAYLKSFRESKGIRLEEIASITKIHLHNLELLEMDTWEKLPPDPFLRGFIVAYGKYVGFDLKELLQRYDGMKGTFLAAATNSSDTASSNDDSGLPAGDLIEQNPTLSTRKLVGALGIVVIVGLLGSIVYLGKRATDQSLREGASVESKKEETTGPRSMAPTASTGTAAGTATTGGVAATSNPAAATVPDALANHKVSIQGSERTWIKVVIDEKEPIEYFLPQGDKVDYQAKDKIKVVLGNATGAKVFYNGKANDGVNFLGTIRSYKFPADAEFPQDTNSKRMPSATIEDRAPSGNQSGKSSRD